MLSPPQSPNSFLLIEFSGGWGAGPVFNWYNGLSVAQGQTSINRLEVRKDTKTVVPHRFIVLYMGDGSIHRFDRRPNMKGNLTDLDVLLRNKSVTTRDECVRNIAGDMRTQMETRSTREIDLVLNGRVDLRVVLSACFAISKDPSAQKYTFYAHNCFFFSWTILMVTARHCLPYEVPSSDLLLHRTQAYHLHQITTFIIDEVVNLFSDLVVEMMAVFQNKSGSTGCEGVSPLIRAAAALPNNVLRRICRHMLKARMYRGLRKKWEKTVVAVVRERLAALCRQVVEHHMPVSLDEHLWLRELHGILGAALRNKGMGVLWRSIFEAVSLGYEDIDAPTLVQEVMDPSLKFAFLGRRVMQFCAVWQAALSAGLRAAYRVVHQEEEKIKIVRDGESSRGAGKTAALAQYGDPVLPVLNEKLFDLAWKAAGAEALEAAQTIVQGARTPIKDRGKRDRMWEEIWSIWDEVWTEAQERARKKLVGAMDRMVAKVLDAGANIVITELSDANNHFVRAYARDLVNQVTT
ncbi:hypothetical protein Moror_13063 [Moniliophthora roreri MCA 2997]|uniref:Uncharacterized protein n=2 Tax=Moniliophthora roreri TaxID=221103 RepID=V2X3V2_MONRO|nr:hypothetical protein Moror_13063 [Moniliophthora roreri MCA 2997]